jgi:hypothetical protein
MRLCRARNNARSWRALCRMVCYFVGSA